MCCCVVEHVLCESVFVLVLLVERVCVMSSPAREGSPRRRAGARPAGVRRRSFWDCYFWTGGQSSPAVTESENATIHIIMYMLKQSVRSRHRWDALSLSLSSLDS